MAGTTNNPTMSKTIEAATKQGSEERSALLKWKADLPLTREEKRWVALMLNGSRLGTKFEQIAAIYV